MYLSISPYNIQNTQGTTLSNGFANPWWTTLLKTSNVIGYYRLLYAFMHLLLFQPQRPILICVGRVSHWATIHPDNKYIHFRSGKVGCFHFISVAFNPHNFDTWCCRAPPWSTMSKQVRKKTHFKRQLYPWRNFCYWLTTSEIVLFNSMKLFDRKLNCQYLWTIDWCVRI